MFFILTVSLVYIGSLDEERVFARPLVVKKPGDSLKRVLNAVIRIDPHTIVGGECENSNQVVEVFTDINIHIYPLKVNMPNDSFIHYTHFITMLFF